MAIRYHFDLYPRTDPKNGARVVRFTKLQSAEYRGEANGTGAGKFTIRADDAQAQLIDPDGLQYVRVVREDTVAATELVVGGFFLDSGDFSMLDERGTRLLSFGGAGTLAYLSRAIMASHTYISPIFTGQDPFDDTWLLYAQSTVYANGNYLGAMLWRVIYEAQHNVPGSHRHADGVTYTDTHADDRPAIAIPDLTMNFTQFVDSNGAAWAATSGEFKAQVGENVLQVVKRLMEAGLYVSMNPDTFALSAYPAATHRRTRTGAAWGTNVIRFQAPTDGTTATSNIKSDAKRAIAAAIRRSWVLAGGNDVYGDATGSSTPAWEGHHYADVNDVTAAAAIAAVQVGARDDAGDTLRLRGKLGDSPTTGAYKPFEHALLDDLVTVHTGTTQFDHNEQTFPIAAITIGLRTGGDWDVWYDLGSSYAAASSRQFQVSPVAAHNHPPNPALCAPGADTAVTSTMGPHFIDGQTTDWGVGGNTAGFSTTGGGHNGTNTAGTFSGLDVNLTLVYLFTGTFVAGRTYTLRYWYSSNFTNTVPVSFGAGTSALSGTPTMTDGTTSSVSTVNDSTWRFHELAWTPNANRTSVFVQWGNVSGATGLFKVSDGALVLASDCTMAPLDDDATCGISNQAARCDHAHAHGDQSATSGTKHNATQTLIVDAGGYYTGAHVEAALQEVGADLATLSTHALDDLSDVTITSPATGHRLRYNGSAWVNSALAWVPLTNGDATTPELIFADGDVVMVEVTP